MVFYIPESACDVSTDEADIRVWTHSYGSFNCTCVYPWSLKNVSVSTGSEAVGVIPDRLTDGKTDWRGSDHTNGLPGGSWEVNEMKDSYLSVSDSVSLSLPLSLSRSACLPDSAQCSPAVSPCLSLVEWGDLTLGLVVYRAAPSV